MTKGNFNTNETGGHVFRIEYEPETEVYVNENDSITIRQPGELHFHDDPMVVLSPGRARLVAAELCRLADVIEAV